MIRLQDYTPAYVLDLGDRLQEAAPQEVRDLAKQELQRGVEYEAMCRGIALVPDPGPQPECPEPPCGPVLYRISNSNFAFETPEIAFDFVARAYYVDRRYNTGVGQGSLDFVIPGSERKEWETRVDRVEIPTREQVDAFVEQVKIPAKQLEAWNQLWKEHEACAVVLREIKHEFWARYVDLVIARQERERLQRIYAKYLDLSAGNARVALRFFRDATKVSDETLVDLGITTQEMPATKP